MDEEISHENGRHSRPQNAHREDGINTRKANTLFRLLFAVRRRRLRFDAAGGMIFVPIHADASTTVLCMPITSTPRHTYYSLIYDA